YSRSYTGWRELTQPLKLAMMSAAAVITVFIAGLIAGVFITLAITFTLARTRNGADDSANAKLGELLAPLQSELERYDQRLSSFDRERAMQFGALSEQLHIVAAASEGLRDQTQQLATALRTPNV